jgi:hypothetical protein
MHSPSQHTNCSKSLWTVYYLFATAVAALILFIISRSPVSYVFDEKSYLPHAMKMLEQSITLKHIRDAGFTIGLFFESRLFCSFTEP